MSGDVLVAQVTMLKINADPVQTELHRYLGHHRTFRGDPQTVRGLGLCQRGSEGGIHVSVLGVGSLSIDVWI